MSRSKFFLSLILALAVVFARAGWVSAAAPQQDNAFITGSDQTIEFEPGSISGLPNVALTLEQRPPVGSSLTELFGDYEISSSFGFGMIAQALWMTEKLHMDGTFFQTILDAKTSGDYSQVYLPDGTVPQNWGQLKNVTLKGEDQNSLGDVVSSTNKPDNSHGDQGKNPENPPGQSKDKDDDHGWRKNKPEIPPGQAKDKDVNGNGNNPVTPPGQDKEKGKDKDKDKEKGNSGNGKPK